MNVNIIFTLVISITNVSCSIAERNNVQSTSKEAELLSISGEVNRMPVLYSSEYDTGHTDTECHKMIGCSPLLAETSLESASSDKHKSIKITETVKQRFATTEATKRSGVNTTQVAVYPSDDLDLVQLPHESSYQAVNSLWTSELDNNSVVSQKAEFRNVTFNQLDSPDALHTINSLRHDDPNKEGDLKQSFKFKSIEMIQRNVGDGVHSMNYVGD